jgi:hypothetical protein
MVALTLEEIDHFEECLLVSGRWTESLVRDVCAAARASVERERCGFDPMRKYTITLPKSDGKWIADGDYIDWLEAANAKLEKERDAFSKYYDEACNNLTIYRERIAKLVEEVERLNFILGNTIKARAENQKEAADLRAENEGLTADIDKEVYSRTEHWRSSVEGLQAENERLRERVSEAENRQGLAEIENERLREALEKIAEHRLPFLKSSEIEIAEIASAALKGEKE